MAKATGNNEGLMNQLQNKAQSPVKKQDLGATVAGYLEKMKDQISKALPKHMDADRMARIALTTIRTNPKLLECNIQSLMAAVMQSSQLGLEPGLIGHCYLIPYKNNKENTVECQFIIGYKGMIDLARRSGNIESIYAHAVYENDEFNIEYGLDQKLTHKPNFDGDRGAYKGSYMVARFKDGGNYFEFMPKSEIEKRRNRSKAANNGPWVTDYEEMANKTVVRHAFKYLPISVEILRAVEQDETIKQDISEDMTEVPNMEVEYEVQDEKPQTDLEGTPFDEK